MNKDKQIQIRQKLIKQIESNIYADENAFKYFSNGLTIDEVQGNILEGKLRLAIIEFVEFNQYALDEFHQDLAGILNSIPDEVWFDE